MLNAVDLGTLIVYLVGIVAIGVWVGRKQGQSSEAYFFAGRNLKWPMIGAALFASNISTVHLVGLAASGFNDGLVWGNFEWLAVLMLIILAFIFAPFYFRNQIKTLPEYLEKRYNVETRMILAVFGILGALFIHIGVSLYAGAVVFEYFFGINIYVSIIIISLLTATYTVIGGLQSVVITESIQTVVLLLGCVLVTVLGIMQLPEVGINSYALLKEAVKPEQMNIIPGPANTSGLTAAAIFLGYPVLGIWYWCADQTIVQRVLGASSMKDAKMGPLFAGLLKFSPVLFMVFPGVLGYVLFGNEIKDANNVLPFMINELLPVGFKGLLTAALLAALMSTIAAALNSASTLVTFDIITRKKPQISEQKLVRIGRITALFVMVASILWAPLISRFSSIFEAINVLLTVFSPPITAVFVFGVFWKRATAKAALITMIVGFLLGLLVFLLDFPIIGKQKFFTDVYGISFMLQAWYLFLACAVVMVVASRMDTPPPAAITDRLCIQSARTLFDTSEEQGGKRPIILLAILLVLLLTLYLFFA